MEDIALGPDTITGPPSHHHRPDEQMAVTIRDAVKIYGQSNVVLRGLNMSVPKGKM